MCSAESSGLQGNVDPTALKEGGVVVGGGGRSVSQGQGRSIKQDEKDWRAKQPSVGPFM